MLAEYLSESEDDNEHLDAEDASGWISSDADEGSGDDLVACSQPGSWAEAIGISEAYWIESTSAARSHEQPHGTNAPMHASSHSMARQHDLGTCANHVMYASSLSARQHGLPRLTNLPRLTSLPSPSPSPASSLHPSSSDAQSDRAFPRYPIPHALQGPQQGAFLSGMLALGAAPAAQSRPWLDTEYTLSTHRFFFARPAVATVSACELPHSMARQQGSGGALDPAYAFVLASAAQSVERAFGLKLCYYSILYSILQFYPTILPLEAPHCTHRPDLLRQLWVSRACVPSS